jgi:hypothetical protein
MRPVGNGDHSAIQVDVLDHADRHGRTRAELAQWAQNVVGLDASAGHLGEHRVEEREIVAADKLEVYQAPRRPPFERLGHGNAGESAADHDDAGCCAWLANH